LKEAKTIRLLMSLLKGHPWTLPGAVLLGLASSLAESAGLSLFAPLLQALDHNAFAGDGSGILTPFFRFVLQRLPSGNPLPFIVALILALTMCKVLLVCGHSALAARINSQVTHRLRTRVFAGLLDISQAHMEATGTGRLVNLLATDTWHASDAVSILIGLVINACSILVFTALLIILSWKLTVLVGFGVVVVSLALQTVTLRARRMGQDAHQANVALSEHMLDALEGLREVQIFGLREHRTNLFGGLSARVRSIYFRLDLLNRLVSPLSEILYVALLLGLLLIGVAGASSIPSMIVFLLVLYRMQPQIRQLDSGRLGLAALTGPVEAVLNFLEETPAQASPEMQGEVQASFQRAIEFDRVSFAYDEGRDLAVDDISFHIPAGKTTAIVGPSGSGKTTLVSLLCRFYEPASGEILLDGRPLSGIDAAEWRSQIAWVSQDAHIFSASAQENIGYGRLSATANEIVRAAQAAGADEFIRQLPLGYETKLGNGGAQLSSGQTQRIALARAFLRNPALLVLDEATNALDSIAEEWIRKHIRNMRGQRTVVIISHRLPAVSGADQVVVLAEGRVSEQGTPRELALGHGLFSRFRELQHVD
jgi:subfamily B ATP-binding cassette protein MsbA